MKRLLFILLAVALTAATAHAAFMAQFSGALASYRAPQAPNAPTGVTATAGSGQNTVNWTAPSADGTHDAATSYTLYGGTSASPTTSIYSGSATSYTHTGLTAGTPYYYRATASNVAGTSGYSSPDATATPTASFDSFTDTFTAANGSALDSAFWSTPRFNGTYSSGGFNIQSNQAKFAQTSASDVNQIAVTVGNSTVTGTTRTIQMDLTQSGKDGSGNVALFVIAASSYPMTGDVAATPNHIRLSLDGDLMYTAAKVGTAAPVYAGVSGTTAGYLNWSGQLKMVLTPTQVSFYIDGVQVGTTYTHGIDFSGGARVGFKFGTTGSNASLTSNVFTADNFTVN